MIYYLDKPNGLTSKDFADKIKEKNKLKKICFCGRLDPMARGKMLLLGNEMCKNMNNYLKSDKIYQFEIILGLQTDSDDPLGIIQNTILDFDVEETVKKIKNYIINFQEDFSQDFHKYSSIMINGKPSWLHVIENNKNIIIPKHNVKIFQKKIIKIKERILSDFINEIINVILKVNKKHNFRQEEIVKQWKEFNFYEKKLTSIMIELEVSSGFYIRQFIRDMSNKIGIPLMVYDINRTSIFY